MSKAIAMNKCCVCGKPANITLGNKDFCQQHFEEALPNLEALRQQRIREKREQRNDPKERAHEQQKS